MPPHSVHSPLPVPPRLLRKVMLDEAHRFHEDTRDQEPEDLDVHLIWRYFGYEIEREDLENYVEEVAEERKVVAA